MKQIFILLICLILMTSCGDQKEFGHHKYWYYYKSISLPPDESGIHGGTFISTELYHIGDQTTNDDNEVIEITSEANHLK